MPLVAQLVELVAAVGPAQCAGKLGEDVILTFEYDPPRTVGVGDDALANGKTCCP